MPYPTYQKYSSFIMATLWNRAGHYIFALWFLSVFLSFFFSSPLCSAVSWPGTLCTVIHFRQAALAPMEFCRVQNSLCVHLRTIASFVGLYLQNYIMHGQSEKLVKQQYLLHMSSSYGELRPTNGWDRLASLGHPSKFQWVWRLGSITARHSSSGRQPNFAALNRGRHLYSTGRPSRWALAHILVNYALNHYHIWTHNN